MKRQFNNFRQKENGFSLIEVLIAIAVLGIFGAGLVMSLSTASKVLLTTDIRDTARDLAEAQMENTQTQPYDASNHPIYPALATLPYGFSVNMTATRLDRGHGTENDTGIQHITVSIIKDTELAFTLEGQKVKW